MLIIQSHVFRFASQAVCLTLLSWSCFSLPAAAQSGSTPQVSPPRTLTRIFFQDDDTLSVKWADLRDGWSPSLGPVSIVPGFPKLDPEKQSLVQMEAAHGKILLGVRDEEEGGFQSGWILIESGVDEEEHGSHSHWYYRKPPRVLATMLDTQQGNPAHLYSYDNVFYLANDSRNGYTRLDPLAIKPQDDEQRIRMLAAFHQGGGGHITLAVTSQQRGYASWIDRTGDNAGRIDVTTIKPQGNSQIDYSFQLPSGGIHGATSCQGKVFFAPTDGICWVEASTARLAAESVKVNHISLGTEQDKPIRTGAFTTFEKYVAFTTGAGATAALHLLDASAKSPQPIRIPLEMAEGNRPAGLALVRPGRSSPRAYLFHDHAVGVEAPNLLSVVDLDPNGDKLFADAKVVASLSVGESRVEGHGGHHSIDFDGDRRRAILSNAGSGTLQVYSVADHKQQGVFPVGGAPSKILAVGGRGGAH